MTFWGTKSGRTRPRCKPWHWRSTSELVDFFEFLGHQTRAGERLDCAVGGPWSGPPSRGCQQAPHPGRRTFGLQGAEPTQPPAVGQALPRAPGGLRQQFQLSPGLVERRCLCRRAHERRRRRTGRGRGSRPERRCAATTRARNYSERRSASKREIGLRYEHSYSPLGGWFVFAVPRLYLVGSESGTDHGSPYSYDTHVPLAFYGIPFQPGTYRTHAEPVDLAVTLASLLGIHLHQVRRSAGS